MQQAISNTLFPGYRRSLLGLLLLNPDIELHGREIARRMKLPSGTVTRELNRLAEVGLLTRDKRGNQWLYSANRACPVFEEVASILRKTSGAAEVLARALAPLSDRIVVACIFGSFARGMQQSGSDIDVLVIGAVDFGAVLDALYTAQQQIGHEINPKAFTVPEWQAKVKAKNAFAMDVLAKPKIFLIGDKDELAKAGRRKP